MPSSQLWKPWVSRLAMWGALLMATAAVVLLLMAFAGKFHRKVDMDAPQKVATIPADSRFVAVREVIQPRYESAIGAIKPVHEANIASKILARVTEVNVTAGQAVKAGDILVRLSDEELITRVRQAEAEWESRRAQQQLAKVDFERARQLIESRSISQAEYEAALAQLQSTQAIVDRAQRLVDEAKVYLEFATVVAPFTGVIVDKAIQPGDMISPGQTLLTLYDPTQMQLVANVRESLAMKLKVGQTLLARLESMGYECNATVSEIVPKSNVSSRSFEVKVSGPCPPDVYIGMFGRLMIPLDEEKLLLIPKSTVRRMGQLHLVTIAESNRLIQRSVQLGRTFNDQVEVLSGLKTGEQVLMAENQNGVEK